MNMSLPCVSGTIGSSGHSSFSMPKRRLMVIDSFGFYGAFLGLINPNLLGKRVQHLLEQDLMRWGSRFFKTFMTDRILESYRQRVH